MLTDSTFCVLSIVIGSWLLAMTPMSVPSRVASFGFVIFSVTELFYAKIFSCTLMRITWVLSRDKHLTDEALNRTYNNNI